MKPVFIGTMGFNIRTTDPVKPYRGADPVKPYRGADPVKPYRPQQ